MHCEICNKYIMSESQYINGKYYHNKCIENLLEENKKLINQQKEFIDWLEENYENTQDIWYIKILNKYKEIIGGKE